MCVSGLHGCSVNGGVWCVGGVVGCGMGGSIW